MSRSNANDPLLLTAAACAFGSLIPAALRQTYVIPHLPDPLADADAIVTSPAAHPFGVPSALLGLASFATTFGLALAAQKSPLARKLLGAKITLDCTLAAYDLAAEALVFHEVSTYSLVTAACTATMAAAAPKPILEALRIVAHDATILVDHI